MTVLAIKSDPQIKADVLNELKWDAVVDESKVEVEVRNGIVTLTGSVGAYPQKLAARDAAHRVYGVLDIVDHLQVRIPTGWTRTDEDIADAARRALTWDVLVPDDRIATTVANGTVTLQGTVDTWTQRADAERAVHRLTGVRGVVNQITVATRPLNAGEIRAQIEEAIERRAEREARHLGVSVKEGVVTLTGTVRSWGEKNAIERVAGGSPGVRRVDDRTTVDPYA